MSLGGGVGLRVGLEGLGFGDSERVGLEWVRGKSLG